MTKVKSTGGMGFGDLNLFNISLLAKQCWKLLQSPKALWARVLEGEYFPKGAFLNTKQGSRAYWWVPRVVLKKLTDDNHDLPQKVAELMDKENNCWKLNQIRRYISEEQVKAIQSLPGYGRGQDKMVWTGSKDGNYVVKKGCHELKEKVMKEVERSVKDNKTVREIQLPNPRDFGDGGWSSQPNTRPRFSNLGQNCYGNNQIAAPGQNYFVAGQNNSASGQNVCADRYNVFQEQSAGPNVGLHGWPRLSSERCEFRPPNHGPHGVGPPDGLNGSFGPTNIGLNAPLGPTNPILNHVQLDSSKPTAFHFPRRSNISFGGLLGTWWPQMVFDVVLKDVQKFLRGESVILGNVLKKTQQGWERPLNGIAKKDNVDVVEEAEAFGSYGRGEMGCASMLEFKGDSACKYWKIQPYIPYLLKQKGNFVDFDFEKVGKEANRAADWCAHLAMKGMCFDDRVSEPTSSLVKVLRSDGLPATHC
ncbi:hypothetical protein GOBAR_DD23964 [Gossypium barbadense]|nr:hypothetical protein GOBAR_DD23964 [Gossypium barbadense]